MFVNLLRIQLDPFQESERFLAWKLHALVTSKSDNCNAILNGLPKNQIKRLQYVLNSAARLVKLFRKHDHMFPGIMELH